MTPQTPPGSTGIHVEGDQVAIPCAFMRGGSSRGPFFLARDLPGDEATRDAVLLSVMGSPHPLQVDGLGGANPLTSKVGIVAPSAEHGVDLDFTFAQLQPEATTVQTTANCGNMLAAVVPFAVESGLIRATEDTTAAAVRTTNTGLVADIGIRTPPVDHGKEPAAEGRRYVATAGDTVVDGVPGTGSPVRIDFLDTAGSVADSLLPTGNTRDTLELGDGRRVEVTCIDNGQPLVIIAASSLERTGSETVAELSEDTALKATLEELRAAAADLMGLGDVSEKSYPKMTLVSAGTDGTALGTRSFIPHTVHASLGVLAAVTVATAACLKGTVAADVAVVPQGRHRTVTVGHPSGSLDVAMELDADGEVVRSGILRTARTLMTGACFVPLSVWDPRREAQREEEHA